MTGVPLSPVLDTAVPQGVRTRMLGDARCHLGEGPTFDPATGTAWWFDIIEKRLFEADLGSGRVTSRDLPVMASALAVIDGESLLLSAEDGLHRLSRRDGSMTRIQPIEADDPRTRSNDGRVHPSGTFWVSTMSRTAERGAGAIYAYRAGRVSRLVPDLTIPNAICFAADGRTGFFADTARDLLCRVDLDPGTGLPTGSPVPIAIEPTGGGLDGAVMDTDGLIWIARWGAGRVDAFTTGGRRVRSVAVPARQPSCPCFVGPRLDTLLVTSAVEGLDETDRAEDPQGGRTFLLDIGATGRPEPRVRLESGG